MPRTMLSDDLWVRLHPVLIKMNIYDKPNLRNTVEGILYRIRVGCPWRDLPESFGKWESIYKRFNEWSKSKKVKKLFQKLINSPDLEWIFADGSVVKAHQHSMGAIQGEEHAIGKSVAGNSTKIHMVVDSYGLPLHFVVTEGQIHDSKEAESLFDACLKPKYWIADRGYDKEELREHIRNAGAIPIIPRKKNSKEGNEDIDWYLYKLRHLVENVFARLKHFRAIATRFDKFKRNFEATLALACAYLWLPL